MYQSQPIPLQTLTDVSTALSLASSISEVKTIIQSAISDISSIDGFLLVLRKPYCNDNLTFLSASQIQLSSASGTFAHIEEQVFSPPYSVSMQKILIQLDAACQTYIGREEIFQVLSEEAQLLSTEGDIYIFPLVAQKISLGAILISCRDIARLNEVEKDFIGLLASITAGTLYHLKARESTDNLQRVTELETLSQLASVLRSAQTADELVPIFLEHVVNRMEALGGAIFRLREDVNGLSLWGTYPLYDTISYDKMPSFAVAYGEGVTGFVAVTGETYICTDIHQDVLVQPLAEEIKLIGIQYGFISLPISTSQGQIVGVIHIALDENHDFSNEDLKLLQAMSEMAGNALDRASAKDALEQIVSERTRELTKANEQLKELDRLKSKFIADISHELRTPITSIGLYLGLLERGKPEKQAHYISALKRQATSLGQMVEQVLDISRIEQEEGKEEFTEVDLNQLVENQVNNYLPQVKSANLDLVYEPRTDLPPVWGDSKKLAQIVVNLLNNALNYTPIGRIDVNLHLEKTQMCLSIQDTGIGITQSEIPHLFERFYRGRQVSQLHIRGSGLGLSLVKEIVDLHRGQIEVTSKEGQGSEFRVYLPITGFIPYSQTIKKKVLYA